MSTTGEAGVSFETDVKPLFREMDRQSMLDMFVLWSYDDVRSHADSILAVLQQGSMPCDNAWAAEQVSVFQRWVEGGSAP
jgi:hypothetical protein